MATFKWHSDAALTTPITGSIVSDHLVDGSDGADDFVQYLGSAASGKKLEAQSNPGVDQIALSIAHTVAARQNSHAYALNDRMRPVPENGYKYKCTVAGTSAASQPGGIPTTIGATFADGGVTWQCETETNQVADVKLATTQVGLDSATWGAGLNLGTVINSGAANAKTVWMRVRDSTQYIQTTDLQVVANTCVESVA